MLRGHNHMKYILGLDIGIASVGYGIINAETKEVVDAGVNIFPEADGENNAGRRSARGARRLKRRRIHRLDRIKQLLRENGLLDAENIPKNTNIYEVKVKGLEKPLTKEELVAALLHTAKRRGIDNINISDDDKDSGNDLSTKDQLRKNSQALKDKYVSQFQLERLKETDGKVRGAKNRFKTSEIIEEAKAILKTQQKYHHFDDAFINEYLHLVETRRKYYEGPGGSSPYGWGGDLYKWYEMLMGRCTYFPKELRSVKYAYSADLFNALNDLNNLVIMRDEDSILAYHEKYHIIENVFKQKKKPTLKQIAKEIGVDDQDIKGYRITKSGTPQFTQFKLFHDLKGIVKDKTLLENAAFMDNVAQILTIYQDEENIIQKLRTLPEMLDDDTLENIASLKGYSGTHRLSLKCIHLVNESLWQSSDNQMAIFSKLNLKPKKIDFSNKKHIPAELVSDLILSPVVKRSLIQAIKMINAVIDKYGIPQDIIIELAREKNSADKTKWINQMQKKNEQMRKKIQEIIGEYGNQNAKYLIEKIKLHDEQEGKCLYSLKDIPLDDLLRNPNHYEVDHIIPKSIVFDNSYNNKVLVRLEENQKKGNKTPYQYLNSEKSSLSYDAFKKHILNLSKSKDRISKKKKEYLLEERDINKFDVKKEFINRNLVDTRYATRELANTLKAYFSANDLDVKVKTINGGFTSHLRRKWKFKKSRDEGYKHHAEDALIIANAAYLFKHIKAFENVERTLEAPNFEDNAKEVSKDTVEEAYDFAFESVDKAREIRNYKDFKYAHWVDKKPNRQLINDTLYSTRVSDDGRERVVRVIKDIYSKQNESLKKRMEKSPESFLMYQHDRKTFEQLQLIFEQYKGEKNPLAKYHEETGEYLRKYSKKGDGPIVRRLKYVDEYLNENLDITDKYDGARHRVVMLSKKAFRFDVYKVSKGYRIVDIRYLDVLKKEGYYEIDRDHYETLKNRALKGEKDAQFIASFYKNDLICLNGETYRVIGVNSIKRAQIELNMVDITYKDYCKLHNKKGDGRIKKGINANTKEVKKLNSDILGNIYNDNSKAPQFIYKRGVE